MVEGSVNKRLMFDHPPTFHSHPLHLCYSTMLDSLGRSTTRDCSYPTARVHLTSARGHQLPSLTSGPRPWPGSAPTEERRSRSAGCVRDLSSTEDTFDAPSLSGPWWCVLHFQPTPPCCCVCCLLAPCCLPIPTRLTLALLLRSS